MANGILLDGTGEDGGDLLPAALALSLASLRPFEVFRFGHGREEPGLAASDVDMVRAAAALCGADVEGAVPGSARLRFTPGGPVAAGEHEVVLGGAGPACRLLPALAVPLGLARGPSRLTLRGGTHVPSSPGFHDLALGWAPLLGRLGHEVDLRLAAAGFEPEGGGAVIAAIGAAGPARPLDLRRRGTLREAHIVSMAAGLPADVPVRMAAAASRVLRLSGIAAEEESLPLPAGGGTGAALVLQAVYENVAVTTSALAVPGEPAEAAGRRAAEALVWHHATGMALDPGLARQVLLPLALASAGLQGGPTPIHRFTCSEVTARLELLAQVVRRFLPVEVVVFGREGEPGDVRVAPEGAGEIVRLHGGGG